MFKRSSVLPAALLAAASCGGSATPTAPSVLILSLDTTRADALSCYGGDGAQTPHLDRLADEGVLYERAHTTAPLTLPAHTSLLTGLYPLRHGVRSNGIGALSDEVETLAERARSAGHRTAAFLGSVVLDAAFGLDQGFDVYDAPQASSSASEGEHGAERPAREVVDAALAWLDDRSRERPFFLFLHFYDPHTPYRPSDYIAGQSRRNYLGEVRDMDAEIGRLLDALRADGTLANTLVVAIGDHGEAFGEHGELGHSVFCYQTSLRIPLIVRWPEGPVVEGVPRAERRAGLRSGELVSVVDVYPTISAALGWPAPRDLDGLDFEGGLPERGLYFESYYGMLSFGWSPLAGWLDGEGKTIHSADPELYDLSNDPDETRNLAGERTDLLERHRAAIEELAGRKAFAADASEIDPALAAELAKLGYAGASPSSVALPHPLDPAGLPSPASMLPLYEESLTAVELAQGGEVERAAAIFERVLLANPKNPFALEQLASCQVHLEQIDAAAATLQRLIEIMPESPPGIWFKLGICLRTLGQTDEAIAALEKAVALAPDRPQILRGLMSAYQDAGRAPEAARTAEMLRRAEARR